MSEDDSVLDNIEIHKNFAIISINPKLYPLSVIYSAAYWLLDRVHVIIDGDPETEILVEIRLKDKNKNIDLKEIGYEFNDELINYSVYTVQATRNKKLREAIIENALNGNVKNNPVQGPQSTLQPRLNTQTQRCDYPMNTKPNQPQLSSSWKPGEQPLKNEDIEKLKKTTNSLEDDLFKGIPGIDTEGIANVQDYRHKQQEFQD